MTWAARGSQLQMQLYVNREPEKLTAAVLAELPELAGRDLCWVAPLEAARFSAPRDRAFLTGIGCGPLTADLAEFGPVRRPAWGALRVTADAFVVLVGATIHAA